MNAAASGLIDAIKASYNGEGVPTGTDWDFIPSGATSWFKWGSGGVNSWGSLCGVPNACAAILNLMNLNTAAWVDQIMYHYCQTELPIQGSEGVRALYDSDPIPLSWGKVPVPDADVPAYTTSGSPLCHVSVSKWAYAAGMDMGEPTPYGTAYKTDRCAKVAAAGAAFTAQLLNGLVSGLGMLEPTATCYSCHQPHPTVGPAQQGKMDCIECHNPHVTSDPIPLTPLVPPTVGLTSQAVTNLNVSFTDNSTDNNGQPQGSLVITANWGDGQVSNGAGGGSFSHDYTSPGKYTIIHTVKDLGNRYASEMILVTVSADTTTQKYSITINVKDNTGAAIPGATVYLKQKKGSDWKQIMYGYTDASGSKTFDNLLAGTTLYKAVVYKSGVDFNGAKTGTQTKVNFDDTNPATAPITLSGNATITVTQGAVGLPPSITVA